MRVGTVCFIVENNKVLLFLIEYGSNNRKWTGIGGFVKDGEAPEDAVIREISEESSIKVEKSDLQKYAEITYANLVLHVYLASKWNGKLVAKDASIKQITWFETTSLPYDQMFEDNKKWISHIFAGDKIRVNGNNVSVVEKFS